MTTSLKWLDMAYSCAKQADELSRIESDLRLQVRKIENTIQGLNDLEQLCKSEAEKGDISLEEAASDAQIEEQSEREKEG